MIRIADGGATNTNWCLVSANGEVEYFNTEGYNPFFADKIFIEASMKCNFPPHINRAKIR